MRGNGPILILGASARAAAWSAKRAGFEVHAVDLFNDRDLAIVANSTRVPLDLYPQGLFEAAERFPVCPWIYTGGLENYPDMLDAFQSKRPLWGNDRSAVSKTRMPLDLAKAWGTTGIRVPKTTLSDPSNLPRDGSMLRKPHASAGGLGIVPYVGQHHDPSVYYQEKIVGMSMSAVFLGGGETFQLLGITRQLIGIPGAEFAYRGNVAPWPVSPQVVMQVTRAASILFQVSALKGLFGLDFVLDDEDQIWPIEVNPRYTASVEALELAQNRSLLQLHRSVCLKHVVDDQFTESNRYAGKEVIYAERACTLDTDLEVIEFSNDNPYRIPPIADIPRAHIRFETGDPVLTVLAEAQDPESCLAALAKAKASYSALLRPIKDS